MSIAYIMSYRPIFGGVETVTATLANELVNRGYPVYILYTYWNSITPMPYELDSRIKDKKSNTINYTGKV